jgi:hypothetical protein
LSNVITIKSGIRQGDNNSPGLFNCFFNNLIIILPVNVTLIYEDNQYTVADHAALLKIATSA